MNPLWSYVLSFFGVLGMWLAGSGKRAGWAIGVLCQFGWFAYALVSEQYGFIIGCLAYGSVQFRNWRKWKVSEEK